MSKCIEIEMKDDGTFMVSECDPKDEAAEQSVPGLPADGEEAGGQSFQSVDQALQAAKQMLMQTPEGQASEQDAQAGFDSVQSPMKGGMQ